MTNNQKYGKGNWRIVDGELQLKGRVHNSTVTYWYSAYF